MLYLFSHGECKQHKPVENQYWPKHGNIKDTEECHDKANAEGSRQAVPKLELRKSTNKRAVLIGATGGEGGPLVSEFLDLRVDLRREKGDKEVEDVDAEAIGDDVESLN